jgi:RHS repeat-associated protein
MKGDKGMYSAFRKTATIFALLLCACAAMGQVATGVYPYGTFDTPGIDTINVGNLNVHFSFPVLNKAGRGTPFYYNLSYDSSVWVPVYVNGSTIWTPAQVSGSPAPVGWQVETNALTGIVSYATTTAPIIFTGGSGTQITYSNFVYHDQMAVGHLFPGTTIYSYCSGSNQPPACSQESPSFTQVASDGSGYTLKVTNDTNTAVTTSTGAQLSLPTASSKSGAVIDSNGNEITADGAGHFIDTTGNTVLTVAGEAPNTQTYTYTDTNGNPQEVQVTYNTYTVQTSFGCSGIGEYGPTPTSLVNSIIYPDGSTYTFSYEATPGVSGKVTGRLAGVQLPQGDTIQYNYSGGSNGEINCADGSAMVLTRTLNGDAGSANSNWTYDRFISTWSYTGVTDGLGNSKLYAFVHGNLQPGFPTPAYYEAGHTVYRPGGGTLAVSNTCYNSNAPSSPSSCSSGSLILPITEIDTFKLLDSIQMDGATAKFNNYGLQTEADVYDFGGSSSRGALLRKEVWTYGYNNTYLTEDEVYDGSGNPAGITVYQYDVYTPTASTPCAPGTTGPSCVPQHVAPTGVRGNLTNVAAYSSSGTYYTQLNTYEDTGSLLTSFTPNGETTLSYDSTFVYNTGAILPTPSSGVTIGTGESFDTAYTGLPLSSTDPNGQITTIPTYDSMLRPTEVDSPGNGKTTLSYSPTQVGQHTYQSSSVYADTEIQYDGYGRKSRTAVANSNGWYQADICYDANGNAAFTSYPYQGSGFSSSKICSGAGDTATYDAMGRLSSVVRANGESISYTYTGRAMESVDANGVKRISQFDGLGRPTIVCEISSNGSMPGSGSPASCGTDITTGATGFVTTYSYALANGLTTVTQGAQTRYFKTDWLGRQTAVVEPESGTTTYSYAYNSTGLVVTRIRPKANQTNPSVKTTTTTQYDSLGRVVSIGYTDGTPTKTFTYDTATGVSTGSGAPFTDLTQANLKGRLSLASAAVTGTAATAFSYDAVGRTSALDECLPSGCGTSSYNRQLQYQYDWAGDLTSSTDGASTGGVLSTYAYSPAGEVLSIKSSLNDSTDPQYPVSNVQNGPNGPVSYSLGNGLASVYHYDALGRLNGGWLCSGGSTSAFCNGGTPVYGFTTAWKQQQLTCSSDTALNQGTNYGYDEFSRLTSSTYNSGTVQSFSWVYDRWGNRWQQNVTAGSGPQPQLSFNTGTNQVTNSGFAYDAAGNMTNDTTHTYTYDAEGNIVAVDGGSTAAYVYNALNQRVRTVVGGTATEYVFNAAGQRVSEWNGTTRAQLKGKYYWGGTPVAFYTTASGGGAGAHFEHQDWEGTERMRTAYNANGNPTYSVEGTFTSLPFGDAPSSTGSDLDANHYATLDHDTETATDHAQFRQYSNTQGRWLSPDPYGGSYDASNPQSFNRYVYAMNSPLSYVDPSGLEGWQYNPGSGCWDYTYSYATEDGEAVGIIANAYCGGGGGGDGGSYPTGDDSGIVSSGGGGGGGGNGGGGGSNNYVSNYPDYSPVFCAGDALKAKGLSIGLDVVGAIPGLGNAVSGTAAVARAVDAVVTYGGAAAGLATMDSNDPVGQESALVGAGLVGYNLVLGGTKTIPVIGNIVSVGTGIWDIFGPHGAVNAYQTCMASGKYD